MKKLLIALLMIALLTGYALIAMGSDESETSETTKTGETEVTETQETAEVQEQTPEEQQESALSHAKKTFASSSYSRSGVISALKKQGYTEEEAIYAADNCGANWKSNATTGAKTYARNNSQKNWIYACYSEKATRSALSSDGFTSDEIDYGIANCGVDWNSQADRSVKSYAKSHKNCTASEISNYMIQAGFTLDQVVYGLRANGY